jgi:CheY-like chemotaxis protein
MAEQSTILIIDDDTSVRKVAQIRLQREGYRVLAAADGEEGLRLARAERPQVILLDILMPRMDGREVLRRLKADPATHAIPVLLLTVIEAHDELHEPIGPGWADRLSKPYNPDQLLQKVQALLPAGKPAAPERPAGA